MAPNCPELINPELIYIETESARSEPSPAFFKSAGAKLAVIRRKGNSKPLFLKVVLTRSLASWTVASGNPTMFNLGT